MFQISKWDQDVIDGTFKAKLNQDFYNMLSQLIVYNLLALPDYF